MFCSLIFAQNKVTVSGTIVDETGSPVVGATIMEKGTANGTVTDIDGNFSLSTNEGTPLTISYIGYSTIEAKAAAKMNIQLKQEANELNEVIVTGYTTQRKADLTGARLVPVTNKDGNVTDYKQVFYPHAVIHDAIEYAIAHPDETPILFMDELNRTTPDVTSEALSIPTLRSIGSKQLPPNLRVITAGNDKGNITTLDEASISRFVLYHVTPDVDTFIAVNPDLNEWVEAVLKQHKEDLFCKSTTSISDSDTEEFIDDMLDDGDAMLQITTPRSITAVSRFLNTVSHDELLDLFREMITVDGDSIPVLQEVLEGYVGNTAFSHTLWLGN